MMMMRAKVNQWVEGTTINQDAYNHWESQLSILCTVSCLVKIDDNKGWVLPACSNHEGDYQSYEDELIMASFSLFSYRLCGNETSEWYHGCSYRTEVCLAEKPFKTIYSIFSNVLWEHSNNFYAVGLGKFPSMSQLSLTTRGSVIQMSTQAREMAIKAIMIRHSAVRVKQPKFFVILLQFVLKLILYVCLSRVTYM